MRSTTLKANPVRNPEPPTAPSQGLLLTKKHPPSALTMISTKDFRFRRKAAALEGTATFFAAVQEFQLRAKHWRNGFHNFLEGLFSVQLNTHAHQRHNLTKLDKDNHTIAIEMDTSLESESSDHNDDRRRSLSCSALPAVAVRSENREVIVQQPWGNSTRDGLGTQWRDAIGYVTDESGPQVRLVRHLFARRLISNGFADRDAFRSVIEFIYSLAHHVDVQELKFFLDSTTFDFLVVCWIIDDNGSTYNRTTASDLYARISARLHTLRAHGRRTRHMDAFNREIGL